MLDMPWQATNELRRLLALPYIRLMFAVHGVVWGCRWRILGMPMIQRHRRSRITIGAGMIMRRWPLMQRRSCRRAGSPSAAMAAIF